jgi:hypothetical protein
MSTGSFPGVESGRGVTLTSHTFLVPRSENSVELNLYSPCEKVENYHKTSRLDTIQFHGNVIIIIIMLKKWGLGVLSVP